MNATPAVDRRIEASPDRVFEVLADGWLYAIWVVGASRMRAVEDVWPAEGARLHHSAGAWPALIDDETTLLTWEPSSRVVLEAKGWPLGTARVELTVQSDGPNASRVSIAEDVHRGPARVLPKPLRQAMMVARNTETLRRLAFVVEGRARL
jgi:uncharacterized protein YndB with AHSA1/START domain